MIYNSINAPAYHTPRYLTVQFFLLKFVFDKIEPNLELVLWTCYKTTLYNPKAFLQRWFCCITHLYKRTKENRTSCNLASHVGHPNKTLYSNLPSSEGRYINAEMTSLYQFQKLNNDNEFEGNPIVKSHKSTALWLAITTNDPN